LLRIVHTPAFAAEIIYRIIEVLVNRAAIHHLSMSWFLLKYHPREVPVAGQKSNCNASGELQGDVRGKLIQNAIMIICF